MFGPLPQQKNAWPNFVLGGPIWACNTAIPPRIEPWTKVKLITLLRTKQFGPWTVLNFFMEWGGREAGLLTHPNRKLWCQSIHSRWFADWTFKFGSPHFPSSCVSCFWTLMSYDLKSFDLKISSVCIQVPFCELTVFKEFHFKDNLYCNPLSS